MNTQQPLTDTLTTERPTRPASVLRRLAVVVGFLLVLGACSDAATFSAEDPPLDLALDGVIIAEDNTPAEQADATDPADQNSTATTTVIDPVDATTTTNTTTTGSNTSTTSNSDNGSTTSGGTNSGTAVAGAPASGDLLGVVKIFPGDTDGGLVIHTSAGVGSQSVGVAVGGSTVIATGNATLVGSSTWVEVESPDTTGWVNAAWLQPLPSFSDLPCGQFTEYGDSNVQLINNGSGSTPPNHIYGLHSYQSTDCDRLVISLGGGVTLPAYGDDFAAGVAADIAGVANIEVDGNHIVATFGHGGSSLEAVSPAATTLITTPGKTLVSRSANGFAMEVHTYFDLDRLVRATLLPNPARLVIDSFAHNGPAHPEMVNDALIGNGPFIEYIESPMQLPYTVKGFARSFEATSIVELRVGGAPGAPGGGPEVPFGQVTANGQVATNTSRIGVMATDWTESWGQFEFTIDALPPGIYDMFIGDEASGQQLGTWVTFRID